MAPNAIVAAIVAARVALALKLQEKATVIESHFLLAVAVVSL